MSINEKTYAIAVYLVRDANNQPVFVTDQGKEVEFPTAAEARWWIDNILIGQGDLARPFQITVVMDNN